MKLEYSSDEEITQPFKKKKNNNNNDSDQQPITNFFKSSNKTK